MTERRERWLGTLGGLLIRLLGCTWRFRVIGTIRTDRPIFALLHGTLLLPAYLTRKHGIAVMISRHRDGEIISRAVEQIGFQTVRGSSTRGACTAVHELLARFPDSPWAVTPDGPKGPRGSVKAGLIRLAAAGGRSIQPVVGAARRARVFRSWDRFVLPWPFAKVVVHFAESLRVPADPDDATCELLARELEKRLADAEKIAQDELASW
jgi:lysophospholipid acyltransferase (LPLAT)-like uncharacterized protein